MKSLGIVVMGILLTVLTSPVVAQQQQNNAVPGGPPYGYGYHHMWYGPGWGGGWGWGWHPWFFLGPLFMLVILVGIVLLVVWLARVVIYGATAGITAFIMASARARPAVAEGPDRRSTFSGSASPGARSTRPSSKRSASCWAAEGRPDRSPAEHVDRFVRSG